MTKKDFEFIASVIHNMPSHADSLRAQRQSCAAAFAERLAEINPRFNRERFLEACGYND